MTLKEVLEHRVDKNREVFFLADEFIGGSINLSLNFEKGEIEFNLFDSKDAATAFKGYLASTEYGRIVGAENLVVRSMPLCDYIKEFENDA